MNIETSSYGSNRGMETTTAPLVNGIVNNTLFHFSQHINLALTQMIRILHFCLVDSLLNYVPEFVVNWIEVIAVWRPQIWRDLGMAGAHGLTQLLCMASLQTLQTKIAVYDTHYRVLGETRCLDIWYSE